MIDVMPLSATCDNEDKYSSIYIDSTSRNVTCIVLRVYRAISSTLLNQNFLFSKEN